MIHNLLVGNDVRHLLLGNKKLSERLNVEKRGFMGVCTIWSCQIEKMLVVDGLIGFIINIHDHIFELIL